MAHPVVKVIRVQKFHSCSRDFSTGTNILVETQRCCTFNVIPCNTMNKKKDIRRETRSENSVFIFRTPEKRPGFVSNCNSLERLDTPVRNEGAFHTYATCSHDDSRNIFKFHLQVFSLKWCSTADRYEADIPRAFACLYSST